MGLRDDLLKPSSILWLRFTIALFLRAILIGVVAAIGAGFLVVAAKDSPHGKASPLFDLVVMFVVLVMVALYIWAMLSSMRKKVFGRPVTVAGRIWSPQVERDGMPVGSIIPWIPAAGLVWGLSWRGTLLAVPWLIVKPILLHLGTGAGTILLLTFIENVTVNLLGFWWLSSKTWGRTRIVWTSTGVEQPEDSRPKLAAH